MMMMQKYVSVVKYACPRTLAANSLVKYRCPRMLDANGVVKHAGVHTLLGSAVLARANLQDSKVDKKMGPKK